MYKRSDLFVMYSAGRRRLLPGNDRDRRSVHACVLHGSTAVGRFCATAICLHPYPGFFAASIALPCQYAACFAATSLARRASGDLCVLATARHTRVCLRVAVLHKSPRCAAAVRLTAAKQAAFGIIECVRRYGAAFFTRARSDGVFSRAIRGEEASPGVVALLLRCASKRRF